RRALPPSLIFAGPKGSGKRQTALALAQTLNCLRPIQAAPTGDNRLPVDACGECVQCTRIERGLHPDVVVVEPSEVGSSTKNIDQIRDLLDSAAYRPFEGQRRVIVLDDAVAFGAAAQNALLKSLEEPTASSVFILITAQPDMLLPTVRSRCIRLTFAEGARLAVDEEAREIAQRVLAHT